MTGFGRSERDGEQGKITVELRSVNSKQLDMNLRVASRYRDQQAAIRGLVSKGVLRGKVDVTVSRENPPGQSSSGIINKELFVARYNEISELLSQVTNPQSESLLESVLRLPEVIGEQQSQVNEAEIELLMEAVAEAIVNFQNFRSTEGAVLMEDLLGRIDRIEYLHEQIPQFEAQRIENVKNRLKENLDKLQVAVDPSRFEAELIFYLEKFDITEEKVRLKQHLNYFREVARDDASGRKLAFISQEIGREINTTGSKANHLEIQKIVVEMKDELEKIKEQLLNIL